MSFVFHRRNKVTEVCKWWQNDDFWVKFPFKSRLLSSLFLGHKHTNMTTQCGVVVQGNAASQKARVKGSLWCHCSGGPARGRVCVCVCLCMHAIRSYWNDVSFCCPSPFRAADLAWIESWGEKCEKLQAKVEDKLTAPL